MKERKGIQIIFQIIIGIVVLSIFVTFINTLLPNDKSFSSFDKVAEYLNVKNHVTIIKTLEIGEFRFVAVATEDKYYFTSKTIYHRNNKYYLFEATYRNTVMFKSVLEFGMIEIDKMSDHYVVLVHTREFDASGKPFLVSDSDGSDFSQLKITDGSVNFYRVYDKLPLNYVISINDKSFKIN